MALFMFRGTGSAFWLPEVASDDGPTEQELTAGFDFSAAFNAIQGLEPQTNPINTPVLKYRAEIQIAGPETFGNIAITVVEDDGKGSSDDALERQQLFEEMAEDTDGVLVLFRDTQDPEEGDTCFMTRGSVGSHTPNWDLGAQAATTDINFLPATPLMRAEVQA